MFFGKKKLQQEVENLKSELEKLRISYNKISEERDNLQGQKFVPYEENGILSFFEPLIIKKIEENHREGALNLIKVQVLMKEVNNESIWYGVEIVQKMDDETFLILSLPLIIENDDRNMDESSVIKRINHVIVVQAVALHFYQSLQRLYPEMIIRREEHTLDELQK